MAEPTLAEMLTNVRTAINTALLNGGVTRWAINGREQQVDLEFLERVEKSLLARQASGNSSGASHTFAAFTRRPS
jgi:hypothetical protein